MRRALRPWILVTLAVVGAVAARGQGRAAGVTPSEIIDLRETGAGSFNFALSDGARTVRVSGFGTPVCREGATASVEGVFQKTKRDGYKIFSEIEAARVTCE